MSHFEFDIHTHTIASGHGSAATITNMVNLHISEILLMHLKTGWESACYTVPRSVF